MFLKNLTNNWEEGYGAKDCSIELTENLLLSL